MTVVSHRAKNRREKKEQQSRHRALFIPKEGKETLRVNLGKAWSRDQRDGIGSRLRKGKVRRQEIELISPGALFFFWVCEYLSSV